MLKTFSPTDPIWSIPLSIIPSSIAPFLTAIQDTIMPWLYLQIVILNTSNNPVLNAFKISSFSFFDVIRPRYPCIFKQPNCVHGVCISVCLSCLYAGHSYLDLLLAVGEKLIFCFASDVSSIHILHKPKSAIQLNTTVTYGIETSASLYRLQRKAICLTDNPSSTSNLKSPVQRLLRCSFITAIALVFRNMPWQFVFWKAFLFYPVYRKLVILQTLSLRYALPLCSPTHLQSFYG